MSQVLNLIQDSSKVKENLVKRVYRVIIRYIIIVLLYTNM